MTAVAYEEFLKEKVSFERAFGFDVDDAALSPVLKPHQRAIVKWCLAGGRRAIFAAFGLGKGIIQLELLRQIGSREGGRQLIVCPLGVRQEFRRDAVNLLGMEAPRFVRHTADVEGDGLYLTNYESIRDGRLDARLFDAVSLDEAAVLRNFGTVTSQTFTTAFAHCRYRFVATATPSPNEYRELFEYAHFLGIMDRGQCMAQPLDASVLTPTGWAKMGSLSVGDRVIAGDGTPTEVIGVYPQGVKEIVKVTFSDGTSTRCTRDHLWLTQTAYQWTAERKYRNRGSLTHDVGRWKTPRSYWSVRTADDIAATLKTAGGGKNHRAPMVGAVDFDPQPVEVDPWMLGFLLGDGCLRRTSVGFATGDQWVVEEMGRKAQPLGLRVRPVAATHWTGSPNYSYYLTGGPAGKQGPGKETNAVLRGVRRYGLLGLRAWEKFVPDPYLVNDADVRLQVLQGLMDADGDISPDGTTHYTTTSDRLADDVTHLVHSLGGTVFRRTYQGAGWNSESVGRTAHRLTIKLPNGFVPFRLPRKAERVGDRTQRNVPRRFIVSIETVDHAEAQCIAVADPDHLYVTDDFIVTHNTRFTKRDSTKANHLTLLPNMEEEFWLWVASWAIFLQSPADLGFDPAGYVLPELDVVWHEIPTPAGTYASPDRDGQGRLVRDSSLGVVDAAREKRDTLNDRLTRLLDIIEQYQQAGDLDQLIVWVDLNDEQRAVERLLADCRLTFSSIYGSLPTEEAERRLEEWRDGHTQVLVAKPVMLGEGVNLQRCNKAVFLGVTFKFAATFQAIHRIQRYGQERTCRVDFVHAESERTVVGSLQRKWEQHKETTERMSQIIAEHGLSHASLIESLTRSIGVERIEMSGHGWSLALNDTVTEAALIGDGAVDLVVTSIPFGTLYEYSTAVEDFGHTESPEHFWAQMDFLTPQLLRMLAPGRVYCCHVKDRIVFGNTTGAGYSTVEPFHAQAILHSQRHGFDFLGMITVLTDVVRENNQSYRLGWSEQCKDGSKMGVGTPEYVLLFRKPQSDRTKGYADVPVVKDKETYSRARWQTDAHSFWRDPGDRLLTPADFDDLPTGARSKLFEAWTQANVYDYPLHVRIGEHIDARGQLPATFMAFAPASWHPDIWHDIVRIRTLNTEQARRGLDQHVCPMPFGIVDRLIERYSNPGDLVYDPFMGIGTVAVRALHLGRRGRGVELHPGYFADAVRYCQTEEAKVNTPSLFDLLDSGATS